MTASIRNLVDKYHAKRCDNLRGTYNETQLRSDFLNPFFELLGWDIIDASARSASEREVLLEEPLRSNAFEHSKKPDYTFRLYSERMFFLEAKKPSVAIETNPDSAKQVRRYGFTAKLKISVLSNFEYLLIYDCSEQVKPNDSHMKGLIAKFHYTEYVDRFEEIKVKLGRESVYSGQFDKTWKYIEKQLDCFSVDDLFLAQIDEWRQRLGEEIVGIDPSISESLLNDCVQSYINRIVFLRICEDRNLETYKTLLQPANKKDFNALIKQFSAADKKYNSGLFDQFLSNQIIGKISSVFWDIIKQLYFPESPYSFAVFSSDILGRIYEIFLSNKLIKSEGSVKLAKKPEHVDRDIVTTPNYVIKAIISQTIMPFCSGKTDCEILASKVADISCGSGAFLLESFQLLNDMLIDYYKENDVSRLTKTGIDTYKLPFLVKKQLLLNCIRGVDKDFSAVEATKFGLLLKLLEDENNDTVVGIRPILPDLSENIHFGNALITPDDVADKENSTEINPFDFGCEKYDIIVGNPPYIKSEDMKNLTPHELPIYKEKYISAYKQFDKYFIFIERSLQLLKDGGRCGYIVPSKFTKVGAATKLRNHLRNNQCLNTIISFGAHQIFKDKTTYTCLLILEKKNLSHLKYAEIRNFEKWRVKAGGGLSYHPISYDELDNDGWLLIQPDLISIFEKIKSRSILLDTITGTDGIFNGIQTSANKTYIFQPIREDENYYYFEKNTASGKRRLWKIEKSFSKPYFQTSSGADNLYTYRSFKPNSRVIYPYDSTTPELKLFPLSHIRKSYPFAYKYLQHFKGVLNDPKRDIKPEPKTKHEWHRYGRSQSLDKCGLSEKIIVGVLSTGDKYAVDHCGTLISSGGTAGYCVVTLPEDSPYSIYYVQALLNSKYLEWQSALLGEVFRGGYIARGTKVLKRLMIRQIDFSNPAEKVMHDQIVQTQTALIEKQAMIDQHHNDKRQLIILRRDFKSLHTQLDDLLKPLYKLGEEDALIPLIKDIYEDH